MKHAYLILSTAFAAASELDQLRGEPVHTPERTMAVEADRLLSSGAKQCGRLEISSAVIEALKDGKSYRHKAFGKKKMACKPGYRMNKSFKYVKCDGTKFVIKFQDQDEQKVSDNVSPCEPEWVIKKACSDACGTSLDYDQYVCSTQDDADCTGVTKPQFAPAPTTCNRSQCAKQFKQCGRLEISSAVIEALKDGKSYRRKAFGKKKMACKLGYRMNKSFKHVKCDGTKFVIKFQDHDEQKVSDNVSPCEPYPLNIEKD